MRAAATIYCSACIARLTGLRIQERAKRAHRMHVCCRYPAPFTPLSLLPDLSEAPSQSAAHGNKISSQCLPEGLISLSRARYCLLQHLTQHLIGEWASTAGECASSL